jgi:hypothetical protein
MDNNTPYKIIFSDDISKRILQQAVKPLGYVASAMFKIAPAWRNRKATTRLSAPAEPPKHHAPLCRYVAVKNAIGK